MRERDAADTYCSDLSVFYVDYVEWAIRVSAGRPFGFARIVEVSFVHNFDV